MICKTIGQMNGVAKHGAAKMLNEGFSYSAIEGEEGLHEVVTAKGTAYKVDPTIGKGGFCSCPFHRNNRQFCPFTTCKHVLALREELAREAAYEDYLNEVAAREEEAAWEIFAELRGEVEAGLPEGFDWPVCEYHGPFEASISGAPLSWCEGCERICM